MEHQYHIDKRHYFVPLAIFLNIIKKITDIITDIITNKITKISTDSFSEFSKSDLSGELNFPTMKDLVCQIFLI